ncbi:MAG: cytochrome C oxidase subunit IV family protein [Verrucomicrobiae bacterium]|nr:cytochrome C oxidase subunit IV family protein [Verrucomicrobiae bacterium]
MSDHSHQDIAKHVKIYITVFVALLVGTIITVALNYLHFDSMALTIAIALFVATIKAALVACYFMHLISERKMIYLIMAFTVFFFIGLMFLTLGAHYDYPPNTTTL